MKLPLLSEVFPTTQTFAELYGGWSEGWIFKKVFSADSLEEQINKVNVFLEANGFFERLPFDAFEDSNTYEGDLITYHRNLVGYNQIVIAYMQQLRRGPLDDILDFLIYFRDQRDWSKFHSPKNLSMAIASESGELLDLFLWDRDDNIDKEKAENELADIVTYCLYLANRLGIDLADAIIKKIKKNAGKYPVNKAKGTAKKYNEL